METTPTTALGGRQVDSRADGPAPLPPAGSRWSLVGCVAGARGGRCARCGAARLGLHGLAAHSLRSASKRRECPAEVAPPPLGRRPYQTPDAQGVAREAQWGIELDERLRGLLERHDPSRGKRHAGDDGVTVGCQLVARSFVPSIAALMRSQVWQP